MPPGPGGTSSKRVNEQQLREISRNVNPARINAFAGEFLALDNAEIQRITQETRAVEDRVFEMLMAWKAKFRETCTVGNLRQLFDTATKKNAISVNDEVFDILA